MWKSEILEIKRHFRSILRLHDEDLFFWKSVKKMPCSVATYPHCLLRMNNIPSWIKITSPLSTPHALTLVSQVLFQRFGLSESGGSQIFSSSCLKLGKT